MDTNKLNAMVSVAHQVRDLYINAAGKLSDDFISVDVTFDGSEYMPAVLLTDDAFYDLVKEMAIQPHLSYILPA